MLISKVQEQISSLFNSQISPLIMSEKELLMKKNEGLVKSILINYIPVVGKDLKELV